MFSVPRVAGATSFGGPQALELTPGSSSYPSSLQARDGTLWVTWQQYYETGVYMTYTTSRGWSVIQTLPTGNTFVISPALGQLRNSSIILLWSSNQTGRWNLFYKLYSNGAWRNSVQLTSGTSFDDFFPHAAVSTNSTVYVFWERYVSSTSASIYYKTLKGDSWSGDVQLSSSNVDVTPTSLATFDGKIWIAWSRQNSGNYNVIYRNYNGITWSPETTLTTNNYDIDPGLVQDRNGTIWIFYSRQVQLSTGTNAVYEQKLFYKYTYDNGHVHLLLEHYIYSAWKIRRHSILSPSRRPVTIGQRRRPVAVQSPHDSSPVQNGRMPQPPRLPCIVSGNRKCSSSGRNHRSPFWTPSALHALTRSGYPCPYGSR